MILQPLTVKQFFEKNLPGCSRSEAHFKLRISLTTLRGWINGTAQPQKTKLYELAEWSKEAGKKHGFYISYEASFAELDKLTVQRRLKKADNKPKKAGKK